MWRHIAAAVVGWAVVAIVVVRTNCANSYNYVRAMKFKFNKEMQISANFSGQIRGEEKFIFCIEFQPKICKNLFLFNFIVHTYHTYCFCE